MAKVLLKFKEAVIREIPLDQDIITIGRKEENDVAIDNQAVSGRHAKIFKEDDAIFVEDASSLNGTYLNGQKITKAELYNSDVILIGVHTMEVISEKVRPADAKSFAVRGRSMDETMVIAPSDQKKILASVDKEKPDVLGGFIIIEGSAEKNDYLLKERVTTIGKESNAGIRLKGFFAPKVAALVNRRKEGYFITPSGGTSLKVNGSEVAQRLDLKDGDIVETGGLKMQFYVKD
jgi:pSer/pThr/pTyr-binding forkhead associated (FHA) protein